MLRMVRNTMNVVDWFTDSELVMLSKKLEIESTVTNQVLLSLLYDELLRKKIKIE